MPKRIFVYSTLLTALGLLSSTAARADDKAKAVLEAGIKAHGGEAVLGKFTGCSLKLVRHTFVDDKSIPSSTDLFFEGPDKERTVYSSKEASWIKVINGQQGWFKSQKQETGEYSEDGECARNSTTLTSTGSPRCSSR
jgi:hypothetical protein